jgi:hypothetical protein
MAYRFLNKISSTEKPPSTEQLEQLWKQLEAAATEYQKKEDNENSHRNFIEYEYGYKPNIRTRIASGSGLFFLLLAIALFKTGQTIPDLIALGSALPFFYLACAKKPSLSEIDQVAYANAQTDLSTLTTATQEQLNLHTQLLVQYHEAKQNEPIITKTAKEASCVEMHENTSALLIPDYQFKPAPDAAPTKIKGAQSKKSHIPKFRS